MLFSGRLCEGRFLRRLNRFAAEVVLDERRVLAHVPNSGRLRELLISGRRVLLQRRRKEGRRTAYDLLHVGSGRRWVCVDARLPPLLVQEALKAGRIPEFAGFSPSKREVAVQEGRIDLLLAGPQGACYVETKAVTLVVEGTALFPDAPTPRGARHLLALLEIREQGFRAAIIFVVLRGDALRFAPHWQNDPHFAQTLERVARRGVPILAYRCRVGPRRIEIAQALPVALPSLFSP